jgi:PAS domain S-box-containing protein
VAYQYQFATHLARNHLEAHAAPRLRRILDAIDASYDRVVADSEEQLRLTEQRLRRLTGGVGLAALVVSLGWVLFLQRSLVDRRRAELALLERERNLAITLDSIGDGVLVTDTAGLIVRINPVAEQLTGCPGGTALGRPLGEVCRLADRHTHASLPGLTAVDGRLVAASSPVTVVLAAHDGTERLVSFRATEIGNAEDRLGAVVVVRDVTMQAELEERIRQTEKMDAIGQLAGGVAHDFNNMLMAISGYAQLLAEDLPAGGPLSAHVAQIMSAADRSAELVRQLLDFSRKSRAEQRTLDLHLQIREAIRLLERSIDPRIDLQLDLAARHPFVRGESARIQNCILNLCLNARDAMPDGGRLRLETADVILGHDDPQRANRPVKPGEYLRLRISDSGPGIDPKVLPRIFEPFFTTKTVGKGTGLGLAAVYGTVQDHAGSIEVRNAPAGGAEFTLFLPTCVAPESQSTPASPEPVTNGGWVLVVDDQDLVRDLCRHTLSRLGYRVLEAEDGLRAEEVLREHRHEVDLVLLDLVMPRRNGVDTFHALRSLAPSLPVILMSGYTRDDRVREILAREPAVAFVEKPFERKELCLTLASFIAAPR